MNPQPFSFVPSKELTGTAANSRSVAFISVQICIRRESSVRSPLTVVDFLMLVVQEETPGTVECCLILP